MSDLIAEKYIITTEGSGEPLTVVRYGFGAAGEEIQKLLAKQDVTKVLVDVHGHNKHTHFSKDKNWRLLDIKQKVKNLTLVD
jgi:hypothetical protein